MAGVYLQFTFTLSYDGAISMTSYLPKATNK